MTRVVNIRVANLRAAGYASLQAWLAADRARHVYIGRDVSYVEGTHASAWANPFSVGRYGLDECLRLYREHVLATPALVDSLLLLEDMVLGCWCAPARCHGDVLVELVAAARAEHDATTT